LINEGRRKKKAIKQDENLSGSVLINALFCISQGAT